MAPFVVLLFVPAKRRYQWMHLLPFLSIALAFLHLLIEGYRWQLVPAYFLSFLLVLCTFSKVQQSRRSSGQATLVDRKWLRIPGAIAGSLLLLVSMALPILFPHLWLPKPSGPYCVGTRNLYFVDNDRPETFTPDPNDHREICARVWYPAEAPTGRKPVSYAENAKERGRILTRHTPIPSFIFYHLSLVDTHSYRDAEVLKGLQRFPIVIFSHAYWGGILQNTVLMEELASHGYVAVSIGHAHETPYFFEIDGTLKAFDPFNKEYRLRSAERKEAKNIEQEITQTQNRQELDMLFRSICAQRPKSLESVRIWADDVSCTVDELEQMNSENGAFAGRLDTDRVGVIGHSMGGTASGQVCLTDKRCKAGINMDGIQLGDMIERNLSRPFMFMHHDNIGARNKTLNRIFFERSEGPAYLVLIRGTRHMNFSDFSLYGYGSVPRLLDIVGEINGKRCMRILNDYVLAFFNKHLKGKDSGLLDGYSQVYPEVEIQVRGG
jgi:predicted dienelactone hydrolase